MRRFVLVVQFFCVVVDCASSSYTGEENLILREYCEREQFEAKCPSSSTSSSLSPSSSSSSSQTWFEEVLLIRYAVYGRMKTGRCVRAEYGAIGCQVDVSRMLHSRCSGRPWCKFQTSELHDSNPCPSELVAFLEASYTCVKTVSCESCAVGGHLDIDTSSGYLSSHTSSTRGCGTVSCPWRLTPKNGQWFNLTFISFASSMFGVGAKGKICQSLAKVLDRRSGTVKDATVCSDQPSPTVHLTTSESAPIEIHLLSGLQHHHSAVFLINFQTLGCEEVTPPSGGWFKRKGNHVDIGCHANVKLWSLECHGNRWMGEVGSCEGILEGGGASKDAWNADGVSFGSTGGMQGLLVVVGVGIVLGILLGFSMLTIAVVMLRKRNRGKQTKMMREDASIYQHRLHGDCPMSYEQSANMTARDQRDNLYGAPTPYAPITDLLSHLQQGSPYKSLTTVINDVTYDSTSTSVHNLFHHPNIATYHPPTSVRLPKSESPTNRTPKDDPSTLLPPPPPPPSFEVS